MSPNISFPLITFGLNFCEGDVPFLLIEMADETGVSARVGLPRAHVEFLLRVCEVWLEHASKHEPGAPRAPVDEARAA